jgi:Flp pilus assembly protein TadG
MRVASVLFRALQGRFIKSPRADFINSGQRGGALLEFVIISPLMLIIVAGIVDFGILFYNKQVLTNASREGARAGIVYEIDKNSDTKIVVTETAIQEIVENYCKDKRLWTFGGNSLPATTAPGVESLSYPSDLTVTVSFNYTFLLSSLLNVFGGDFGPTLDISAATVMRME